MLFTLRFPALRDDMELYALSAGMVFPRLVSSEKAERITNNWTDRQTDRQTNKHKAQQTDRLSDLLTESDRVTGKKEATLCCVGG